MSKPPLRVGAAYSLGKELVVIKELRGAVAEIEYLTGKKEGLRENILSSRLNWAAKPAGA